uniref:Uncharacterized protein n=1 Tax=Caenorhabditis japonica TaxID=281687 RepID=A0A8R1DR58_CAEJA
MAKEDQVKNDEAVDVHIKTEKLKRARNARKRYHDMTDEEKRVFNKKKYEAYRIRRMEEDMILAMPIDRVNEETLDKAQQIINRNAKRAEAARRRYHGMAPDEKKLFNRNRYAPNRLRDEMESTKDDDALSALEREVDLRTQRAQEILLRKGADQKNSTPRLATPPPPQDSVVEEWEESKPSKLDEC